MNEKTRDLIAKPDKDISALKEDKDIGLVLDRFLKTKRSQETIRAYSRDINGLFERLNMLTLGDLARIRFVDLIDEIEEYLDSVTKLDAKKRPLNPKTVNRKAFAISSFFKYLMHAYGYPQNPLATYQAYKVDRKSTTPTISRAEIIDVLAYMSERRGKSQTAYRDYLAFACLAVMALRRNEVVGLKWSDFDFAQASVKVYQKGGTKKLLPLPKPLLDLFTKYKETYPSEFDYVFTPARNPATKILNKPISADYIYAKVIKVLSIVIPDRKVTPHSFRKAFIEIALNNQEDFLSIINATGHATVEMVNYYDTRDPLKNNAINKMGDVI